MKQVIGFLSSVGALITTLPFERVQCARSGATPTEQIRTSSLLKNPRHGESVVI